MKQRNTTTALALAGMLTLCSCESLQGRFSQGFWPFPEEGPVPELLISNKTSSQDVTDVTSAAFPISHEYAPTIINDRQIAFVSDFNDNLDIFYMDYTDGGQSGQFEMVVTDNNEKAPFIFTTEDEDGRTAGRCYYVTQGNGKYEIFFGSLPRVQIQTTVLESTRDANWPELDESGERMLFSALDRQGQYQIWLKDASGVSLVANGQRARWNPANPDEFVYVAQTGTYWQIFAKTLNGSKRTLTAHTSDSFDPAYSPDGTRIAFTSNRQGSSDIWIMDADGSNPSFVTEHGAADCQPVWSPDGNWLLFSSNRGDTWDIWKVSARS